MQVDEPFEREGDVPVQTVAEPPDAWRLTVGGGVGRDHILDCEVLRRDTVTAAKHHRDGRPARVDERGAVSFQLLHLEAVGPNERGWPFLLDS